MLLQVDKTYWVNPKNVDAAEYPEGELRIVIGLAKWRVSQEFQDTWKKVLGIKQ